MDLLIHIVRLCNNRIPLLRRIATFELVFATEASGIAQSQSNGTMSKGETNQSEIARILQVDRSTICRDVDYLRQQAKENIAKYVDERLPEEYEMCLVGLNSILKEAWTMSQTESMKGDKIKALSLAKQ
jgi:hypothetical protein